MAKEKDKKDFSSNPDKYNDKPVRFYDKGDHYALYFTDDFELQNKDCTILTDIMIDLQEANKDKELHIFINSYGGYSMTLSMLLSSVMLFKYRVTICTGIAASCGILLWCTGHERYVSPYSELMLHEVSSLAYGKGSEITRYGYQMSKLSKKLYNTVNVRDIFTEEELKLSETSEVWFIGSDLISRNKAKDISEYSKRVIPSKKEVFVVGDTLYEESNGKYTIYTKSKKELILGYSELVALASLDKELPKKSK